jgi:hypothetical protein
VPVGLLSDGGGRSSGGDPELYTAPLVRADATTMAISSSTAWVAANECAVVDGSNRVRLSRSRAYLFGIPSKNTGRERNLQQC